MAGAERWTAALDRVLELVVVIGDDMTRGLARDGLTTSRATLLYELRRSGPVTQRELARALGVSARTITGLVDGLVVGGFVTREPHPTDRRAFLVTFTEHGTRTVEALEQGQRQFAELLFGDQPDERLDEFVAGLEHVLGRLREQGISPEIREEDR
ncbi:MarR family winged helix-turn-helix transcriptional regulator [Micromonospora sp. NPDC047620]|uniref:MarR family winged helix-turn-helix transcriptional regulator n=1 Tax=Micromonospora sp. NPDC047620 TaxID=3364251 RepID=UPI003713A23D